MPALPRTARLSSTREMWHKETSERTSERASGRKSVSVLERVCVHFLNAPLTAVVAYERGLVLVEQMAEC